MIPLFQLGCSSLDEVRRMSKEENPIEILVVEDNPDEALLIKEALMEGGLNCHLDVVHTAKECLGSDLNRYGVILLDYNLPDMLGIEVLKRVLDLREVPVLMVTGMDATEIAVEALKIGAYDYIVKSDRYVETLSTAVERVVEKHRLTLETKRLQEELSTSEKKYRTLINGAVDGVICIDHQMKITLWNPAAERIFGYKEKEILGQNLLEIFPQIHKKTRKKEFALFGETNLSRARGKTLELEGLRKDGSEVPVELSVSTHKSPAKYSATVIARDITERKRAEEEIRSKNKELEDFAYTVSHDLKNPLWAIDGYSSAVLEDYQEKLDEEGRDYLHRIKGNTQKMAHFIDDLLKYSRAGGKTDSFKEADLSRVLEEVLTELKVQIDEKGIKLVIHDLPSVFCDETRMAQVFTNLIHNSIKFSKNGGSVIKIGCEDRGTEYQFYVKDNGIGFDKKDYDKIFGMFQRLNGSKDYQGTGVGLPIVKKVIESHGGKIWPESEKGKGAIFYFTLPKKHHD